jgi:subtilase family serine protease
MRVRRSRRRGWKATAVLLAVTPMLTVGVGSLGGPDATAASPGGALIRDSRATSLSVPRGAVRIGTVAARGPVNLRIALAPRDPAAVTAEISSLYDRTSSNYHRWLKPGQFARAYGPSRAEIASSIAWLHARGLTRTRVNGFTIDASASAATASTAFGLRLQSYRTRAGRVGYVPTSAPLVPTALEGTVQSIIGLNSLDTPVGQGAGVGSPSGTCTAANDLSYSDLFTYPQIEHDYGIDHLVTGGQDGAGETVALYELEGHDSGVNTYDTCFGLSPKITTRAVDGGGAQQTGGDDEADVDIEAVANDAPAAAIESYEGPNTADGAYDTWAAIVDDDTAQVVSSSWDVCEGESTARGYDTLLEQAATQGQSVLVASGDDGAQGCQYADPADTVPAVDYPASSPYVVAVGGTALAADGSESAWNWCAGEAAPDGCTFGAGGGGVSVEEAALAAQEAVTGHAAREVPDISANAGTGMVVNVDGNWAGYVGTSLATPMVASLIADRNNGCETKTGLFTPALYADASSIYGTGLDDVTTGNNDLTGTNGGAYAAGTGYDMATGLGSPLATGLTCADVKQVSPPSAAAGADITLSGLGLEGSIVHFGTVPATVVSSTATSAVVVVPPGAGTVAISATSTLGAGNESVAFTYPASGPTVPGTPGAPTAVAGNGDAVVSVTDSTGGAPLSYTVTAVDSTAPGHGHETATIAGASGSVTVPGLTNGDLYTFTATAADLAGVSAASPPSNAVTPNAPVSSAPTPGPPSPLPLGTPLAPHATAGDTTAAVTVSDPAVGGLTAAPTSYTVTSIDTTRPAGGGRTCTVNGPSGTCTVTGLVNGDRYGFVALARDAGHVSLTSAMSNVIIPTGSDRTSVRVTVTGVDPHNARRVETETLTVRNVGAKAAIGLTLSLTKVPLIGVRSAPGWKTRGQVLSRRLTRLAAGSAVTYKITLYLRSTPTGVRDLTVVARATNAAPVTIRHRFG